VVRFGQWQSHFSFISLERIWCGDQVN
jgi:hypothetical protein